MFNDVSQNVTMSIASLGGDSNAALTIPAGSDAATLTIGTADSIYADPFAVAAFSLSTEGV
jgi:hypothetical protein